MLTGIRTNIFLQERNRVYCFLAIFALISSGFGVIFSATADQSYLHLMRMAAGRPVSIVGSFLAVIVPYVVSVLVVTNSKPWLVYLTIAVRIFLFASACWAIASSFGTAGALVSFLFLFSDIFLIPVLLWFAISSLSGNSSRILVLLSLVYISLIGIINYCAVSPFLVKIINTYEAMGRYANSCWT